MDTVVSVEVVDGAPDDVVHPGIERALSWFRVVEQTCSRFDPSSELRQLCDQVGHPVHVSPLLFETVQFALALAESTGGAFDPTIGRALERKGFDRNYLTGERTAAPEQHMPDEGPRTQPPASTPRAQAERSAAWRSVLVDSDRRTITLAQPLLLDLGAVAKGLAVDLAARELRHFAGVCVDAGGDLFARGANDAGQPWRIGIQHPRDPQRIAYTVELTQPNGAAVCTSGDYERRDATGQGHHILDPRPGHRRGQSPPRLASVSVIAGTAMSADGLATAAFVLGPRAGRRLLESEGAAGVFITPEGAVHTTRGLRQP